MPNSYDRIFKIPSLMDTSRRKARSFELTGGKPASMCNCNLMYVTARRSTVCRYSVINRRHSIEARLAPILKSRSLPVLIGLGFELLNEAYPAMEVDMPQTHGMISNIPAFFEDKIIRRKKVAGGIEGNLQHKIGASKWKERFGNDTGRRILEETSKNKIEGKKEADEKVVGEVKAEVNGKKKEKESSVAANDAVSNVVSEAGEVLERWLSWIGSCATLGDWGDGSPLDGAA